MGSVADGRGNGTAVPADAWAGGEWRQLAVLVPVVVLLSVARELGGSVRASLMVHVVNNGLAAAGLIALRLME